MKFYNDKNKVIMVQTIASANTFVSSITGIIKKRLLDAFPKSYFNGNVYVDTSETYQEVNKNKLYNKNLNKLIYPSLTITPALSVNDSISGLKNILMSSPNFWLPRDLHRNFKYLLADPNEKYQIFFSSDYISFNIRFKIVTNSFIQATNIGYFLKSRFDDSTFKYLSDQLIQVEVPKSFINAIAKIEGIFGFDQSEIDTEDERKKLDELLIKIGMQDTPIIRKRSLNTGKDCYFFNEKENLLTLFTDLDIPESVIRDNSINGEYEINFRIQISAWWPNAFIMQVNRDKYQEIAQNISFSGINDADGQSFYSINIGKVALDRKDIINFYDSENEIQVGQNIFHEAFTFNKKNTIDRLNFSYFIPQAFYRVHSYAKEKGYDLTKLFNVIARTFSSNSPNIGAVDYNNLYIDFDEPVDSDIVLDIFVNRAFYDALLKEMSSNSFFKNPKALALINISYYDTNNTLITKKVKVYSFESEKDYNDTTLEKSLRTYTPYGVGYIGLVRETDPKASPFKICLGHDKYGNAIIRCLEISS